VANEDTVNDLVARSIGELRQTDPVRASALADAKRLATEGFGGTLALTRPIPIRPLIETIHLVRVANGVPFLTLPIEIRILFPPKVIPPNTFEVPAGSIWFASQLLAPAAPASSWTGLQVNGGTLRFSGPVTFSGTEVVVPAGVTVSLTATSTPQTPSGGSGPGQDSRNAQVEVPASFRLVIEPGAASFTAQASARLAAFGYDSELDPTPGPVQYDPALDVLTVPLAAASTSFAGSSVASVFSLTGTAPVTAAAWGLPVIVTTAAQLTEATGTGSLLLWLDPGLTGTWLGQSDPVDLNALALVATPSALRVVAGQARSERVIQQPTVPAAPPAAPPGRITLRWTTSFPITFDSEAHGIEGVLTQAGLSAVFDRPVDLNGNRVPLRATSIMVVFLASTAGTFMLVDGALDPPSGRKVVGFSLINALLRATWPSHVAIYGNYDGTTLDPASVQLGYQLTAFVPTLPDPYAASYGSLLPALDQGNAGLLTSKLAWTGTSSAFDFQLPGDGVKALAALSRSHPNPFEATDQDSHLASEAVKALGGGLRFEQQPSLILLDVSTNVDQFGVAFASVTRDAATGTLSIDAMTVQTDSAHLQLVTLPAVQWEAVETVQDPDPLPLPQWVTFANSGVPTVIGVPTTQLVPVHPSAALTVLVKNFEEPAPLATFARFTLPFGMLAVSSLHGREPADPRSATVAFNRPSDGTYEGAHQLRIDAIDDSLTPDQTPALPGYTVQLPLAKPGNRSVLGNDVTTIFNTYVGAGGTRRMVPVTRIDISGYGESLFSDWENPYADPTAVVQARFDVLIGRTAYEIIKVRSVLFPYGQPVVRTITIQRRNNAVVTRSDSGWQSVGDGEYVFPGSPIITHPGVVNRITNVVNIHDTGQVLTVGGVEMAAVYFDGDLDLDGAPIGVSGRREPVPAKAQFGFIQISAVPLITPAQYADLLTQAGPLGGPVDCGINIGQGPQVMRLHRVDVGATQGLGGPEFVMTAWGAPAFPGGGQWSVVQIDGPVTAPVAVAKDRGLPLIRAGAAGSPPSVSSPFRFADPIDLAQPTNPASDYAVLHSMGTQRALYPRPFIKATDPTRIVSTLPGTIADPYTLGTSTGPYPSPDKTIPFTTAAWALIVDGNGNYRLDLPSPFPAGVGRRTIRAAGSVTSDVDYSAAQISYLVDTSQPIPWQFKLDQVTKIMNSSALGDIIQLTSNVHAVAGAPAQFQQPNLMLGGSLSVVQDLLTILSDLGISGAMTALMTNDWSLKVAEIIPFVDATGDSFQIPPSPDPLPDIKFDETQVKVEIDVAPTADKASFSIGGQPMFAIKQIPGLYAVAIIKFEIDVSTSDGTVYALLIGVGLAYEFEGGPLKFKGLIALTMFGFMGDTVLGFGVGFLMQLEAAIEPIISIQISLEGQLAVLSACRGTANETTYGAAKLTFGVEVTLCLVFSISVEVSTTASEALSGPGAPLCALPDVLPNAS
jgi:hypothetical protein